MTTPLLAELGRITEEAGRIAQHARLEMSRELKSDGSIVTNGDRAVETFLRKELTNLVPGSTVWGEEFGKDPVGVAGRWAVDPIDGTSNFAFGSPLWGVAIGLVVGQDVTLGSANLPDLGEVYLCQLGSGVTRNGVALPAIPTGSVAPEELVCVNESLVSRFSTRMWPGKLRNSGSAIIDGMFTVSQRFRGLMGLRENLYDLAPTILMGRELGGDVRFADGEPIDLDHFGVEERIQKPWMLFPRGAGYLWSE
ncbi:MAG: inositol monophosphatase family protein [Fimbriimonas sp.]